MQLVAKACELRDRDRDRNLEQVNDQRRILPGKYDVVRQLEVRAMHRPLLAAR